VGGRRGPAIVAGVACAGCVALYAILSVLDGRARSILILPLALAFFWGFSVLAASVLELIFGGRDEEPTRAQMSLAAAGATVAALALLALAGSLDSIAQLHAVAAGARLIATAAFWVSLGCVAGAIFGKLPESGMSEGD
jgi:hypothetical protein